MQRQLEMFSTRSTYITPPPIRRRQFKPAPRKLDKPAPRNGYAVVQHTGKPCVWGVGKNIAEALKDALRWIESWRIGHPGAYPEVISCADILGGNSPDLKILPCSPAVYKMVERDGGEIVFEIRSGRVVLPTERN